MSQVRNRKQRYLSPTFVWSLSILLFSPRTQMRKLRFSEMRSLPWNPVNVRIGVESGISFSSSCVLFLQLHSQWEVGRQVMQTVCSKPSYKGTSCPGGKSQKTASTSVHTRVKLPSMFCCASYTVK